LTLKEKIYDRCIQLVNDKIHLLQKTLADLKESAANETKSTAGDKHETALAMLQIEQENTGRQLQEVLLQKSLLLKIDSALQTAVVVNGSLVETNKGFLFISIALGKMVVDETTVIALSPQSPLGAKLMGSKVNDSAEINGNKYVIGAIM